MCASPRFSPWLILFTLLSLGGCRCSKLSGKVDSLEFKRCAQLDPPEARSLRAGALELVIEDRLLSVKSKQGSVRVAAFAGPVGAALTRYELSILSAAQAELVIVMGGLGDDEEMAKATLAGLSTLRVPVLFIAGGADRVSVFESAFDDLDDRARDLMIQGSGLRELRVGRDRFAILAGAPEGRYAIDEDACGFEGDDVDAVREAIESDEEKGARVWLLSWGAPAGFGVTRALSGQDVGSEALSELAEDLGALGGLFAFPESAVGQPITDAQRKGLSLVVPRLGRTGATRAEGGRVPSGVAKLTISGSGLVPR